MQISSLGRGVLQRGSSRGLVCRPLHAGHAAEAHPPKKSAVAVSAAPSKQEPGSNTTSSMPRLPPRKGAQPPANPTPSAEQGAPRPKSSSSSSSRSRLKRLGSFAGGPNQPPPSEPPHSAMQEKALAGLLAYTGLMGTIATAVAFCTPGVDLFGGFHWDAADVSLALKLMLPVYGLNLLIMLPNYSSWKLPEVTAESQAAMVEAIAKWSAKKRSKGSSRGSSRGSSSAGVSMADGSAEQRASAAAGDAAAAGSVVPAAEGEAACHAAAAHGCP
ncbi:hypothetical protein COO60DRAFT_997102 [Scenedesmus sp. NREL 46B-D3]|nr:hypothetical protein COO60DRAFT_997102 [Scenedesmus sp. NREL 46B-D3]